MADQDVTRRILDEINREPAISQKKLAEEIGISVGMINWHVKRCVSKGLIKLQQAPVRRYLYYLTSRGFAEKARLTGDYLQAGFGIFHNACEQYDALFGRCEAKGWHRIALVGNTELTELALLVAARFDDLVVVGIIDENSTGKNRRGISLFSSASRLRSHVEEESIHAAIICHYPVSLDGDSNRIDVPEALELDRSRYLVPAFLR